MKLRRLICGIAVASIFAGAGPERAAAKHAEDGDAAKSLAAAHAAANGDPLLEALLTELERSKAQLKMDQVATPYYIEYRVSDVEEFLAEAAYGALRENQSVHVRLMRVVVRVGDYKQDSYFHEGMGQTTILPLDDDPIALRHQIWLATDEAYKDAGQSLTEKQAALKQFTADEHPVDDFANAPAVTLLEARATMKVDAAGWKKALEDATNLYREYPEIQSLSAFARFSVTNEYYVNSEGTVTRTGRPAYSVQISASTQAPDGMRLSRSPAWTVAKYAELPTNAKLVQYSKEALETLKALRNAPIVDEEYRGPILFEADAADDVVTSLIGNNVLGRKPQLGAPNRTTGAFATSYKSKVLPPFIDVVDDPTMKEFQGKSTLGSYDVDSEGVKAQAVNVIDKGVMTNYLLGRQPIRDFPASNGHGRGAPSTPPGPNLGVLVVKSSEPKPLDELIKAMIEKVSAQGQPFGYRVVTMGGSAPRLLYRVYAKDGHEELVRGAVFNELDIRALRNDLSAAGNDPIVTNRMGGVSTTVICPSLLFDELEVKRADTSKDKLPDYPAPPLVKK
ncbi:MAG TPA: metallopeptidase TldD-related protein [Candidatus Acidoferrum sp.]|nr:metallopeptidase TldD-related protein [Candidatus Acidoferrum sp.]